MRKDQETLLMQILDLNEQLEERKKLYETYDRLVMELQESGFTEGEVGELKLTLKDNFLDKDGNEKNTAYRIAFVKRFELSIKKRKGGVT